VGVPCVDACLVSQLTGKVVVDGQEAIQTQLKGDGIIYQQVQIEPNTLLYSKNNGLHRYFIAKITVHTAISAWQK
jgi:hypothetical protein